MQLILLSGIGAGLISAVTFASATTGSPLIQFVLFLLTPLPVYLAGLSVSWVAASVAGLVGGIALAVFTTPVIGIVFAASQLAPAGILSYLSQLARSAGPSVPEPAPNQPQALEWYPVGRLIVWTALIAIVLSVGMLMLLGQDVDSLKRALREFIQRVVEQGMPDQGTVKSAISDAELDTITDISLKLLPAITVMSIMGTLLFNLWLAGRITLATGRLRRPWPDLATITYPSGIPLLLAISVIGAAYAPGMLGLFSSAAAGAIYFAYILLGLAILHYITRGNAWRPLILWSVYFAFLVLNTGFSLILVVMALLEPFSPIRRDFLRPPSPPKKPPGQKGGPPT
ncbi:Predicted membrane protein [Filomicrobium insigne]|uniref:Predicted membrane protein n=1 Tax=Filomicrobium insigne TaxID=418854 RepID=A0A1H0U9E3_9HYPH|nr:DUF2232 domain-containing protein [Filomicrobium insigne]SDP62615.1 Predicted membrane protein [Filomicrobium insigne]